MERLVESRIGAILKGIQEGVRRPGPTEGGLVVGEWTGSAIDLFLKSPLAKSSKPVAASARVTARSTAAAT